MAYVIGIDQSTQSTKVILFDQLGNVIKKRVRSHEQIINSRGWVSHNPIEIYHNVIALVKEITQNIDHAQIKACGITNQRETGVAWDRVTGRPIADAVVWQCIRGKDVTDQLSYDQAQLIKERTGLPLSPYFTASKYAWFLKTFPTKKNQMIFGTMDTWLVYKLTKGKVYQTDVSNASRTQLMNLSSLQWDLQVCQIFGLELDQLPTISASDANFGQTDFEGVLSNPIPIHAVMGDSHAALFAHKGFTPGDTKATYGTGSSIMMNIGSDFLEIPSNLTLSVGWQALGQLYYVLEGNVNYTGSIITWLQKQVELIQSPEEIEPLISKAKLEDKTLLIPAFSGLGAPFFRDELRASFLGMSRITGRSELVKASIEAIAFQIQAVLDEMNSVAGLTIQRLSVDGGPTKNQYLMQFQSDLANTVVDVSNVEEASCTGVAIMAGIATKLYELSTLDLFESTKLSPNQDLRESRLNQYNCWRKEVQKLM